MRLATDSCLAIKRELETLFKEFHVPARINAVDLTPEVNYFELDKTSFVLAVETCMFGVSNNDRENVVKFFLPDKTPGVDLESSIHQLITKARSATDKEELNNKIKTYFGMGDIFDLQPVAFRGRNYDPKQKDNSAIYINVDHQELQLADGFFEHLVTHEYVHLNAHGKGFVDWQDERAGRSFIMCQKLDEGVTELIARLITYRRKKQIMYADNLPKYELSTRVADALVGTDGEAVLANAYFKGEFDAFNQRMHDQASSSGNGDVRKLLAALANADANMEHIDAGYIEPLLDWGILAEAGTNTWDSKSKNDVNPFDLWKTNVKTAVINKTYLDPVYRRIRPAQTSSFLSTLFSGFSKGN